MTFSSVISPVFGFAHRSSKRIRCLAAQGQTKPARISTSETLYSVDNGWNVEEFKGIAVQLHERLNKASDTGERQDGEINETFVDDAELWVSSSDADTGEDSADQPLLYADQGWSVVVEEQSHRQYDKSTEANNSDLIKLSSLFKQPRSSEAVPQHLQDLMPLDDVPVLDSLRPHELKQLRADQTQAYELRRAASPAERRKREKAKQRHTRLKIISGGAAGKRLHSPAGEQTRPMMEKVRGSLFSMLLCQAGGSNRFPAGMRWLDLFAGTGAIGLEGLSRGCDEAHFVEADPWVIKKCLAPNIHKLGYAQHAMMHSVKVEDFLQRSLVAPSFAGGPFDFVSVTPPYLMVSYPQVYGLLAATPLIHKQSVVFIEYSRQNKVDIRDCIGPLSLIKTRRYGRTYLAVYALA